MSDGQNGSLNGGKQRKVPKVFSKEAITKFRAWLFQNLTVRVFLLSTLPQNLCSLSSLLNHTVVLCARPVCAGPPRA